MKKYKFTYKNSSRENSKQRTFIGTWNEFEEKIGSVLIMNVEEIEEE